MHIRNIQSIESTTFDTCNQTQKSIYLSNILRLVGDCMLNEDWYPSNFRMDLIEYDKWRKIANTKDIDDGKFKLCIYDKDLLFSFRHVLRTGLMFNHLLTKYVLEDYPDLHKLDVSSIDNRCDILKIFTKYKIKYDKLSTDDIPMSYPWTYLYDMKLRYAVGSYIVFKSNDGYFTLGFDPLVIDTWKDTVKQICKIAVDRYGVTNDKMEQYSEELERRLNMTKEIIYDMYDLHSDACTALALIVVFGQSDDMISTYSYRTYRSLLHAINMY